MSVKKYNFNEEEITCLCKTGEYIWIAFKGKEGVSRLYKSAIRDPEDIYFEISVPVDKIVAMKADDSYIYLAVEDDICIGYVLNLAIPLSVYYALEKLSGVDEYPVDIAIDENLYCYILTPGKDGNISTVYKYLYDGTNEDSIIMDESGKVINNASSITCDLSGNLWVVTYEDLSKLVKIYDDSGYTYDYWPIYKSY